MRTIKSYFFLVFHYRIFCKAKMGESRVENFYFGYFPLKFKNVYSLLLKDCFHCFTDENKAFFKR